MARWISRASGTPAVAVETEVAVVAAGPQLPLAAEQHRQQAHRRVELEQHRLARRLVVLVPRRQQADLRRPELRRPVDHRQLAAAGAAGVISPAAQTRTAPLILDSPKWLAIPTVCRR